MQTFLPVPLFYNVSMILDYRRLGKQRVEAKQILNILLGRAKANKKGNIPWSNHPAVLMWKGYEEALMIYHDIMIETWIDRGYNNNMEKFTTGPRGYFKHHPNRKRRYCEMPPFIGDEDFHASHRSNLLRKNHEYYSQFGWQEPDNLPYVWPTNTK